jgi:hypothetical protein
LSEAIEIEILEIAANAKPWIIEHNEELWLIREKKKIDTRLYS